MKPSKRSSLKTWRGCALDVLDEPGDDAEGKEQNAEHCDAEPCIHRLLVDGNGRLECHVELVS